MKKIFIFLSLLIGCNQINLSATTLIDIRNEVTTAYTYSITSVTVAMSGNDLQVTGGDNSYQYFYHTAYGQTCLSKYTCVRNFKAVNKTSTSYGIGLGVCVGRSAYAVWNQTSGANAGKILFYEWGNNSTPDLLQTSASAVSFNAGDEMRLTVTRNEMTITATILNLTQGLTYSDNYTFGLSYPQTYVMNGTGYFTTICLGGTQNIHDYNVTTSCPANPDFLFIGDSKTMGLYAGSLAARIVDNVMSGKPHTYVNDSGGGDVTSNAVGKEHEIADVLCPKYIVWCGLGRNDIADGFSSATWQANISSFVTYCKARGIKFIWCYAMPDATDITPLNTWIAATYPNDILISGTFTALANGTALKSADNSGDNVHPSPTGNTDAATQISSAIGYLLNY